MLEALNLKNNTETRYRCQVSVYRTIGPLVLYIYDGKSLTTLCMFAEYHVMYFAPVAFINVIKFCILYSGLA